MALLLLGCSREPAPEAAAHPPSEGHSPTPAANDPAHQAANSPHGEAHGDGHGDDSHAGQNKATAGGKKYEKGGYAVPFVWETSAEDPLAVARLHVKEMLTDNALYAKARSKVDVETPNRSPRTTVLACSDAAFQFTSLDASPENDAFVARNWGNLLEPSLGTVAYGIEQLHTPVLLIVGHTGCEAVKTALGGKSMSRAIRKHLGKLKVKASEAAETDLERINEAVLNNVNKQVAQAVERFEPLVHTGALTVIGAIYDEHNAFKMGSGRLSVVNVNTITAPDSMRAFVTAITHDDKLVVHQPGSNAPEHAQGSEHAQGEHETGGHAPRHDEHAAPTEKHPESHGRHAPRHDEHAAPAEKHAESHGKAAPSPPPNHGLPRIENLEASLVDHATPHRAAH